MSGHRDRCLISGAWGQGEGIVSGLVDTDEYVFHHEGYEHSARIADKDIQVTPDPSGAPGTVEAPVPEPLRAERCLSLQRLGELGAEFIRLERFFGAPMDIEWTVCEGTLYILQARPITSLPDPPDLDAPLIVFDNSNIQESYCGVTTPLTFSFAAGAYASVYTQTMRALGLPERTISAHAPMLKNLLGLVCGRVYYNINNWYRGLLLLLLWHEQSRHGAHGPRGARRLCDRRGPEHRRALGALAAGPEHALQAPKELQEAQDRGPGLAQAF